MITVNGTDLATLGFVAADRPELPVLGGERTALVTVPGFAGGRRVGSTIEPAMLTVRGTVRGATHAAMLANLDALAALLRTKPSTIRFDDYTDREWVGYLQQSASKIVVPGKAWITTAQGIVLQWALPEPTARAQAVTTSTAANPTLVLGTAPSPVRLVLTNGAGAPNITQVVVQVRNAANAVLRTLTWQGVLSASQVLVVDAETFTVTANGANAINGLTQASDFPIADPAEGADDLITTVTGGATITRSWTYRRRWY